MKEYVSVQKWFSARDYKSSTMGVYLQYMAIFCGLLHKTPDELASLTPEEALKTQQELVAKMKEEFNLRDYSITQRVNALHGFWRANGVELTKDIMTYLGSPRLLMARTPKDL